MINSRLGLLYFAFFSLYIFFFLSALAFDLFAGWKVELSTFHVDLFFVYISTGKCWAGSGKIVMNWSDDIYQTYISIYGRCFSFNEVFKNSHISHDKSLSPSYMLPNSVRSDYYQNAKLIRKRSASEIER